MKMPSILREQSAEKDPELKRALEDLDEFLFGY